MDLLLEDKRVVVTGSSRGIGFAIARRFAKEGARLMIAGRDPNALASAVGQLNQEGPHPASSVSAELSQPDGPAKVIAAAVSKLGGVDILVGNTGGPPLPLHDFIDTSAESWAAACDTQLMSLVRLFRAALPVLRDSGRNPAIVIVSSVSVKEPMPHHIQSTVYRAAVASMCKRLAHKFPQVGVRVNVVSPASVRTERLVSHLNTKEREARTPLLRLGDPDEFASVVVFAASPVSGFMHGTNINVDGGYTSAWW